MKSIIFVGFFFLSLSCFSQETNDINLQQFDGDILIVKTFESLSGLQKSTISISDGDNVAESIRLKGSRPKNVDGNLLTIVNVLNQIKKQGYQLIDTNSGGASEQGLFITNYIFERVE